MRITVKKTKHVKQDVKRQAEKYLKELIGHSASDLSVVISFRKLKSTRFGVAGVMQSISGTDFKNQTITINSILDYKRMLKTLAHECTHVKQVYLQELTYKNRAVFSRRYNGLTLKSTTVWNGREYRRKAYENRPWEIEARKMADLLTRPNMPDMWTEKPIRVQTVSVENAIMSVIETVLKAHVGGLLNTRFYSDVLSIVAKSDHMLARRVILNLRNKGIIEEFTIDGTVYVKQG